MTNNNQILVNNEQLNVAKITFSENLINDFMKWAQVGKTSFKTYLASLKQFFMFLKANGIDAPTNNDALAYAEYLKANLKPTTTQSYLNACKQFFKWTNQFGYYPNIMQYVKGAKIEMGINPTKNAIRLDQVQRIIAQFNGMDANIKNKRDYAIILLLASCGLRTIELERANIGDLQDIGNTCFLWVHGKGRADKNECVEVPTMVRNAIDDYLKFYPKDKQNDDAPLFVSVSNHGNCERITKNSISRICKNAMRNVDIENKHAHGFRHFAITQAILNGADLTQVQQMARHKSISTTMIYNHAVERATNHCETSICNSIFGNGTNEQTNK